MTDDELRKRCTLAIDVLSKHKDFYNNLGRDDYALLMPGVVCPESSSPADVMKSAALLLDGSIRELRKHRHMDYVESLISRVETEDL